MKYFSRSFKYLLPYKRLGIALVALIVASGLAELLAPWPLKILVDNVLGNDPVPPALRPLVESFGARGLLVAAVASGLLVALVINALALLSVYVQTSLEQRMVLDLRSDLFQHAQRLSIAFHDRRRSSMLIYAINSQGDAVPGMLMAVPAIAQSCITLVGMFWIVLHMDVTLALMSLMVVPFLFYSVRYYANHIQQRLVQVQGMEVESLSIVHEALSMLRVIVAFGREPYENRRFRSQGAKAVKGRINITVRQTLFSLVVNMTTAAGTAAVLGFGAYRAMSGFLTVGDLLVVMAYIASVYKPLQTITYTIGTLQDKIVSQRAVFNLLDTPAEVRERPNAVELERARGAVRFEHLDFSYEGRVDTIKDVSFEVEPGQTIAIVGPTGAGKTTLISLLPRFYDPSRGRILLDGVDLKDLTLASLRRQLSLVLQEPLLFSGTVAENIRYGKLESSDIEIVEAARAANAHDFIMRLPKQYETELGERGAKLSGGERQRLCVARAFLKNAPILILDEPTSAIDSRTEAVILEALDRLMAGRTSFMIAHRLSTIHHADRILVLDRGRLIESGTHDELLLHNGLYRHLHDIQGRGRSSSKPPYSRLTDIA